MGFPALHRLVRFGERPRPPPLVLAVIQEDVHEVCEKIVAYRDEAPRRVRICWVRFHESSLLSLRKGASLDILTDQGAIPPSLLMATKRLSHPTSSAPGRATVEQARRNDHSSTLDRDRRGSHFSAEMSAANPGPGVTANPSAMDVRMPVAVSYSNDTALESTVKCR